MTVTSRIGLTGVSEHPLETAPVADSVRSDTSGALVVFEGIVRNHDAGRSVSGIDYSAHPAAGDVVREVAEDVATRHPECRVALMHRTGALGIGDMALVAAVSSPHRSASFAAIQDLVDTVKIKLPVWKRQLFTDGTEEWVGSA